VNITLFVSAHFAKSSHRSWTTDWLWFVALIEDDPFVIFEAEFLDLTKSKTGTIIVER